MKRIIVASFALLMLLLGSSYAPAEARYGYGGHFYGGYHGGWGRGVGLGLGGLGIGLGLGALGASAYYNSYPYGGYYNPYYAPPVNVYTAPAPAYYGYGGPYWY